MDQDGVSMNKTKNKECERCGNEASELYSCWFLDEETNKKKYYMICWDCDWEIMNGQGEITDDPGEIYYNRLEMGI